MSRMNGKKTHTHNDPGPSQVMLAEAYQDHGAYNLMCGRVFFAMPTCPVMTTSRRAEEPRSRRRFFAMLSCPVVTNSRESETKISRARRRFREQDGDIANETKMYYSTFERALPGGPVKMKTPSSDQDNYSGGLILILMIPTLGPYKVFCLGLRGFHLGYTS